MRKSISLFLAIVSSLTMANCSGSTDTSVGNEAINAEDEATEANRLLMSVEEYRTLSDEEKAQRRSATILMEYVTLKDSVYSLEISEENAVALGIDREMYRGQVYALDYINRMVEKQRAEGKVTVVFSNPQELVRELRDSLK